MRKLKLQVQMSIDGFIAGPNNEMDWMTWEWDDTLGEFVHALTKPVDTILLGGNIAHGFIETWEQRAAEPEADWFARKMVETPKVVFSTHYDSIDWNQTLLAKGELAADVQGLKDQAGGDLIAYGGARFVSKLIAHNLIDEYFFFVNPVVIGDGKSIFGDLVGKRDMKLVNAFTFECGIVVLNYRRI